MCTRHQSTRHETHWHESYRHRWYRHEVTHQWRYSSKLTMSRHSEDDDHEKACRLAVHPNVARYDCSRHYENGGPRHPEEGGRFAALLW